LVSCESLIMEERQSGDAERKTPRSSMHPGQWSEIFRQWSNRTAMPACCSDGVVTVKKCLHHVAAGLVVLGVGLVDILVVV